MKTDIANKPLLPKNVTPNLFRNLIGIAFVSFLSSLALGIGFLTGLSLTIPAYALIAVGVLQIRPSLMGRNLQQRRGNGSLIVCI